MPHPEDDDLTKPILVRYDMPETDQQRVLRQAKGLPTPTYSFMCSRITNSKGDENESQ